MAKSVSESQACNCDLTAACDARGMTPAAKRAIVVMRILIVLGLVLTFFLSWVHLAAIRSAQTVSFPLCGELPGLDCDSVLNSPWAKVWGQSVALLGFIAYLLLFVSTIRFPRCPWSRVSGTFIVATLVGGGLWFLYVQAMMLRQWCLWCTATHAISITLALIIWPMAIRRSRPRVILLLIAAGLACMAAVASAQYAIRPPDVVLISQSGESGAADPEQPATSTPKLDLSEHIVIGSPQATQYVIEAMDFRCHRCASAWPVLEKARELLNGKVAVVVLPTPLSAACNRYISHTPQGFEMSCELAKLAWAVWLSDSAKYMAFHRWLLENQACTVGEAKTQARLLVGDKLEAALSDERIVRRIKRDIDLAGLLSLERLPGMMAGRLRISAIPDDPDTLAKLWMMGLAGQTQPSNPSVPANQPKQ